MNLLTPSDFHDAEKRKRTRRSTRPCDACRKAKTRCLQQGADNEQTAKCVHCHLRRTECTFSQSPPARATSSQARRGDRENRDVTRDRPSPQDMTVDESQSQGLHLDDPKVSEPSTPQPQGTGEGLYPWLGEISNRFSELYGLGSDMEPVLMRHRPYDRTTQEYHLETHAIRLAQGGGDANRFPLTFHMASDEKAHGAELIHTQSDAIQKLVHPHGPRLLDLFWRNVQPSFPIIHKPSFIQTFSKSPHRSPPCLIGAMFLLAAQWWAYDRELSTKPPPDMGKLRQAVLATITNSYHRPRLSSIQAMLLFLQCNPEDPLNPDHTFDWGLTSQALAVAQCLGLHLDCSKWSIPEAEKHVRKRLSWALFMQDRWTALAYGRPVHIHDDDWTVADLEMGDFGDDSDNTAILQQPEADEARRSTTFTGIQQFMAMAKLTQILSDVLVGFYSAKASKEQDIERLVQRADPIFDELRRWQEDIPISLNMHITYQRGLSFHGYLHFSYYGVTMNLLRRLIRAAEACKDHTTLSKIRQRALNTAQGAINFVSELRPDHLEAFWYFTSPYLFSLLGSFTTLLLVTSLSSQERSFWQDTLNSYLWRLRTLNKNGPIQYAANRLEGAILRGLEHALAVNVPQPDDATLNSSSSSQHVAGYSNDMLEFVDFGDWDLFGPGSSTYDILNLGPESPGM